jgi:hypothetical protein
VSADGRGVVGHAGARLVADIAEVTGLTGLFGDVLAVLRQRQGGHDPGRVAVDLAVMLADGGEAISDLAVLRDQAQLFGPVASDPTAWRLLSNLDSRLLDRLAQARAAARETAWAQRIETRGGQPQTSAAGASVPGLVLDMDASIVPVQVRRRPGLIRRIRPSTRIPLGACGNSPDRHLPVCGGAAGSCTVTRSPPASRGVRVRVPSCAWVMLLTIARPRPTPAWSVRMRLVPR